MKKNTLDGFLKMKALKDKITSEPIKIKIPSEEEGGEDVILEIPRISEKEYYEIVNAIRNEDPDAAIIDVADALIYHAFTDIRQPEVLEAFGCSDNPPSIVKEIFTPAERMAIYQELSAPIEQVNVEVIKN